MLLLWLSVLASPLAVAAQCRDDTPEIRRMKETTLTLHGTEGTGFLLARIADSRDERSAGFQHLCPQSFGTTAILFVFEDDIRALFHMHNVHAPLDIAFIDAEGTVLETMRMELYDEHAPHHPLYGAARPFRYALETGAGRMADLGLAPGARIAIP